MVKSAVNIVDSGGGQMTVADDVTSSQVTTGNDVTSQVTAAGDVTVPAISKDDKPRTRKVKGRGTRATRRSLRRNVEKPVQEDDAVEDRASMSHEDDEVDRDGVHGATEAATEADECQSDNTEILSVHENDHAAAAVSAAAAADDLDQGHDDQDVDDDDDDDDDDGAELTHRSSPASYKSDEQVMTPPACHDDVSRGNYLLMTSVSQVLTTVRLISPLVFYSDSFFFKCLSSVV